MRQSLTSPRKDAPVEAVAPAARTRPAIGTETLIERLAKARTANEITNVIGLKPIKGRSGPKIAY